MNFLRLVVAMGLFCTAVGAVEAAGYTASFTRNPGWSVLMNTFLSCQFNGFAVMAAVLVAERAAPAGQQRWWPYVLAVGLGVAIGTTAFWFVTQRLFWVPSRWQLLGRTEGFGSIAFRHASHRLPVFALMTYVYVSWRWAAQRLEALRAVQLQRTEVERDALAARLAAMQARIDPRFLLDALARVEHLYDVDARAADRMLKDLTDYMRAVTPRVDAPAPTLQGEVRLANAYLNLIGGRSRESLSLAGHGEAERAAAMPPLVLLPLVIHALAHRAERAHGDEKFAVGAERLDDRLRVTIHDSGSGFAPAGERAAAIAGIREHLSALYDGAGRLSLRADARGGSSALIEIPYMEQGR